MIRIHATVSKKVPIPGLEYSSRSYMAGLEVEAGDGCDPGEIRQRLADVYSLLEDSIDREIEADVGQHDPGGSDADEAVTVSHNSSPSGRPATQAQVKAIFAIARSVGLQRSDLTTLIQERYHAGKPEHLSVKQASELIDSLQSRKAVA